MTRRAAIYTRFSTDRQNENSNADQEALARAYASREGLTVTAVYADAALSGGSILGRDGLQDLLADARAGRFDVVIVEALDRLSRDMEDLSHIHKRLKFAGIDIVAVHEGTANTVTVGLRGLVGQLFREDNAQKTRRGLQAKIRAGRLAGGRPYGYRLDPLDKGKASIDDTEADVVRRIYADYIAGRSPRQIAYALNAEAVPGPSGGPWQASAIYGWPKRGTGILRNPIYDGRIVWNRMRFVKDPETGRRVSRANPADQHQTTDAPELRIIAADVFAHAQRLCGQHATPAQAATMKRPKKLLSGLLRCGGCGGGMSTVSKDKSGRERIVCTRHREQRSCPAPKTFYADAIDDLVIDTLRGELHDPQLLVDYVTEYNDARRRLARENASRRVQLEKRAATLDAQIERMVRQLAEGIGDERRIGDHMRVVQAELDQVRDDISAEPSADVVTLHSATIARYQSDLLELKALLTAGRTSQPLADRLRSLIATVTVYPNPDRPRGGVRIDIQGRLRLLLDGPHTATPAKSMTSTGVVCGALVAGAGFEPTTFRL